MAKNLGSARRVAEAEEAYNRVITIVESSRGVDSAGLVLPLSGLGNLLLNQGKPNAAEIPFTRDSEGRELLEECLVITEKYKGKDHPSLASQFINLATSYSFSKNYVEAERLLRMSLRVMMKAVGPDDPSITFPMLHLAVTLFNLSRDKEAERLAIDVVRIRETAFGKESLPVGEALDCLVSIQTRLGEDDEELLELLKRVLRIQEKEFGHESEEVMITLKKILFYLDKLGRKQEKFPVQRRLSVLRDKYRDRIEY